MSCVEEKSVGLADNLSKLLPSGYKISVQSTRNRSRFTVQIKQYSINHCGVLGSDSAMIAVRSGNDSSDQRIMYEYVINKKDSYLS